jgi:hypothetical protein
MCGLDKAFNKAFQINVMDKNMKNSLFIEESSELEANSNKQEEKKDVVLYVEMVMDEALT